MKRFILFIVCCIAIITGLRAQEDSKYLLGAVPVGEDGLVHFKTTLNAPALTQLELYNVMKDWANDYFKAKEADKGLFNPRILFHEEDKGTIVANGEEYLVFTSSFISLDRTRFYYHLIIQCKDGSCDLDMTNIRYLYNDGHENIKYTAEEWITDKYAVRKSGTKLVPISSKFRRKTIDAKDELFKSAQNALGEYLIKLGAGIQKSQIAEVPVVTQEPVVAQKPVEVQKPVEAVKPTEAQKPVEVQKPVVVPQETVKPAAPVVQPATKEAARIMISANGEEVKIDQEAWGGYGEMFGKKVAFIVLDTRKAIANLLLTSNENFTISFYKEGESKPSEVINCKRLMQQNINAEEAAKINAGNKDGGNYNMFVGEIVR